MPRYKIEVPEHVYRHGKDRFNWKREQIKMYAEEAYKLTTGAKPVALFALVKKILTRHVRVNAWAEHENAIWIFCGRVAVGVYRKEET